MLRRVLFMLTSLAVGGMAGIANATLIGDEVTFAASSDNVAISPFAAANSIVDGDFEFLWDVNAEVIGPNLRVTVDFGDSTLDLGLIFERNSVFDNLIFIGYLGNTTLTFSNLNWVGFPDGEITSVDVVEGFDSQPFTSNVFTINLTGPNSFDLVFSEFAFGANTLAAGLSSLFALDVLKLAIRTTHDSSVPEPASLALFAFGLLGLGAMRRRRRVA